MTVYALYVEELIILCKRVIIIIIFRLQLSKNGGGMHSKKRYLHVAAPGRHFKILASARLASTLKYTAGVLKIRLIPRMLICEEYITKIFSRAEF